MGHYSRGCTKEKPVEDEPEEEVVYGAGPKASADHIESAPVWGASADTAAGGGDPWGAGGGDEGGW